jgi:phosphohistidine phosphatase
MPSDRPSDRPSANTSDRRIRRLVLIRHAKSKYPSGVPDHDRPLAGRGRRNAQAVGDWFVTEGPELDLVLTSDAQRARHTWEIISARLPTPPPVRLEPDLYGASSAELVALARSCDDTLRTLAMVGHEPTLSTAVLMLAGGGSDADALARMADKFPTGGIAVLRLTGSWSRLAPGRAVLETFVVPRA